MGPISPGAMPIRQSASVRPPVRQAPFEVDPGNRGAQSRKASLRDEFLRRRQIIPADLKDTTRWKVINHLRTLISQVSPGVVALYHPRGTDIDLHPLAEELWRAGQTVALPRVPCYGHPMTFNIWLPDDPLSPDALGIPAADGAEIWPALMVVPMLGYNRRGYRLGIGGGYYDRTIKALPLPILTVGVCYTELEIADFPSEYADIRLDTIVTGREIITCV